MKKPLTHFKFKPQSELKKMARVTLLDYIWALTKRIKWLEAVVDEYDEKEGDHG